MRLFQLQLLISGQYANGHQRFGPGHRADDILFGQAVVEAQRVVELFEPLICCLCKTPTPKCHNMLPLFVSSAGSRYAYPAYSHSIRVYARIRVPIGVPLNSAGSCSA